MKTNLLTFASIILAATASSASPFENCAYEDMLAVAIQNALITRVHGESIVHSGGPATTTPTESLLVADLVSQSGYREIHLIYCDGAGQITDGGSSIRLGKVVFTK